MASNAILSIVNRLSNLITNIQSRLDTLETNSGLKAAPTRAPDSQTDEKITALENLVKELKLSLAQNKDDSSKDRTLIESTIMFKVEQYVNRSIKERMDIMSVSTDEKIRKLDIDQRVEQAFKKLTSDLEPRIRASIMPDLETRILSSLPQVSSTGAATVDPALIAKIKAIEDKLNKPTPPFDDNRISVIEEKIRSLAVPKDNIALEAKLLSFDDKLRELEGIDSRLRILENKIDTNAVSTSATTDTTTTETTQALENNEFVQARRKVTRGRKA